MPANAPTPAPINMATKPTSRLFRSRRALSARRSSSATCSISWASASALARSACSRLASASAPASSLRSASVRVRSAASAASARSALRSANSARRSTTLTRSRSSSSCSRSVPIAASKACAMPGLPLGFSERSRSPEVLCISGAVSLAITADRVRRIMANSWRIASIGCGTDEKDGCGRSRFCQPLRQTMDRAR